MLAIATDIDRMTIENFRAIHKFCNSLDETAMGPGLGLDIADSFWVFGPPTSGLTLFNGYDRTTRTPYHDELVRYIHCGWIDTLHSYGNFGAKVPFARAHAEAALEHLSRHDLKISAWSNHGSVFNTQNLGNRDDPSQMGDIPGTTAYHVDLLRAHGTWILWRQARAHNTDSEIAPFVMKDEKHRMWAFTRTQTMYYNQSLDAPAAEFGLQSFPGGRIMTWQPQFLPLQLARRNLDQMIETGRPAILGQHLGSQNPLRCLNPEATAALRELAERHRRGDILVARTSRLVEYTAMRAHVQYRVEATDDRTVIVVERITDPVRGELPVTSYEMIRGLTFNVTDPARTLIAINGHLDEALLERYGPRGGVACIGIKWHAPDHNDHSADFARRPSRKAVAAGRVLVAKVGAVLSEIAESHLVTDPAIRSGIEIASEQYRHGFDGPIAMLERLGTTHRMSSAIFGSGVGHLAIACSLLGGQTDAIDTNAAEIDLSRYLCRRLEVSQEVSFSVDDPRHCSLTKGRYGQVICYGLLERGAHEEIVAEANRVLLNTGVLHVACEGVGAHLSRLVEAICRKDWPIARTCVGALTSGILYESGVFHTPFATVRFPAFPDLIGLGDAYGFLYNGRLGSLDRKFIGFDAYLDVHFRKLGRKRIEDEVRFTSPEYHLALAERCIAVGAPAAAIRLLDASKLDRNYPSFRLCRLRGLIKAGMASDAMETADRICQIAHEDARRVAALREIDCGRFSEALAILGPQAEIVGETGYLRAACYLISSRPDEARAIFAKRVENAEPQLRDFIGLLASALVTDRPTAAQDDLRRLVSWRRARRPEDAAECDAVLARLG
jgi:hypothetical protein